MTRTRSMAALAAVLAVALAVPGRAAAQSRQDLQAAADMRILQENVSKLQLAVNQLGDLIKTVNRRLDDENAANLKRYADQRQAVLDLAATVNTIREKLDDNTVRVSQLTQEVTTIRDALKMTTQLLNQLISLLQPPASGGAGEPPAAGAPAPPPSGGGAIAMPESPTQCFNQAWSDFMAARYSLSVTNYESCLTKYPNSTDAPKALLRMGDAYYAQAKYKEALATYARLINNYKDAEEVPEAYFEQGVTYQALGQTADARRVYQLVKDKYPNSLSAVQADQKLKQIR